MRFNKNFLILIIFSFILIFSISTINAADNNTTSYNYTGGADSPSPGYNGANGTGQSNYTGPQTNTTKSENTGPMGNIAIGSDGKLYSINNKMFYIINKNGSYEPIQISINGAGESIVPVIGNNETIYLVNRTHILGFNYNESIDGYSLTNTYAFGIGNTGYKNVPIIAKDGFIYIIRSSSAFAYLFKLTPNLDYVWNITFNKDNTGFNPTIFSNPIIDYENNIYIAVVMTNLTGGKIFKVNPNGTYEVFSNTPYAVFGLNYWSDRIYAVGMNSTSPTSLFTSLINFDGSINWIREIPGGHVANAMKSFAISKNGIIYVGTATSFYAINASNGDILNILNSPVIDAPVIGVDGTIYVVIGNANTYDKVLYALNPDFTVKWTGKGGSTPVIDSDGTLYTIYQASSGADGVLIAYQDDLVPPVVDVDGDSGTYFNNVTVRISVDDGVIYYTIDGSDPRTSDTRILLTGSEIIVNESCVLKIVGYDADAFGDGQFSNVTVLNYVIRNNFVPGNPSVSSGSYYNDLKVSLPTEDGLKVYYKIDNGNYMVYNGPISIGKSSVLSYYYEDASGNVSSVKSVSYVINKNYVPGNPSVASGAYNKNLKVSLPKQTGKTLYYKVGSGSYKVYTSPITVTKTSTISYYFKDTLGKNSKVKTVKYTIDKTSPKVLDKNTKSYKKVRAKKQTLKIRFSESIKINSKYLKKLLVKNSKGKKIVVKFAVKNNYLYMKVPKITKKTKYFLTIPKNIVSDKVGNLLKSKVTLRYVSV